MPIKNIEKGRKRKVSNKGEEGCFQSRCKKKHVCETLQANDMIEQKNKWQVSRLE